MKKHLYLFGVAILAVGLVLTPLANAQAAETTAPAQQLQDVVQVTVYETYVSWTGTPMARYYVVDPSTAYVNYREAWGVWLPGTGQAYFSILENACWGKFYRLTVVLAIPWTGATGKQWPCQNSNDACQ